MNFGPKRPLISLSRVTASLTCSYTLTGVGEYNCICEKCSGSFVAPEEPAWQNMWIASSDVCQWLNCIVGNAGFFFPRSAPRDKTTNQKNSLSLSHFSPLFYCFSWWEVEEQKNRMSEFTRRTELSIDHNTSHVTSAVCAGAVRIL